MKKVQFLYGVLAITLIALLFNLNSWGVIEASEARYAEISREMFRSGNLLHPTLLNISHYHKPPITFLLTGLGFKLFGVNAFGARFFLQLSLVAQGGLVYLIAKQLFGAQANPQANSQADSQANPQADSQANPQPNPQAKSWTKPQVSTQTKSLLAAIIYLSLPLSLMSARNLTTDSFLTTLVLAVIYCMGTYYFHRRVWGIYGSALFIGLGFLIKGPAIFVVPFFFWGYLMLARRVDYRVPIRHLVIALVLCIGLGLSWYVYVAQQIPGLGDYFIGRQVVARVMDDQAFNRAKPAWFYPLILVTTTLPWGFLYGLNCFSPNYKLLKEIEVRQLALYWLGLPLVVFALSSSKLMMYLLPLYPGIALILACLLANVMRSDLRRLTQVFFCFYSGLGGLTLLGPLIAQQWVALEISGPMILSALLVLIIPTLVYRQCQQPMLRLGLMALSSFLAIALYSGYCLGANELLVGGTRPLAQFIQAQALQDEPVLVYGQLLPSLAFNLDRDIITISDEREGHGITRETEFQTDDRWQQYWIYPDQPDSMHYLDTLVQAPSVFIIRGEVSERWGERLKTYPQTETIGQWTLFYRRS